MKDPEKEETKIKNKPKMPTWMECTWRRVPCGKESCPICGKIAHQIKEYLKQGEVPDNIKIILADVEKNFKEIFILIEKDIQKLDINIKKTLLQKIEKPPEPENFSLYRKTKDWRNTVYQLAGQNNLNIWKYTEEAEDLFWYANLLPAKVYRQLCNRWHIKKKDNFRKFDFEYTSYVLDQCLTILEKSLSRLLAFSGSDKGKIMVVYSGILNLRKKIKNI